MEKFVDGIIMKSLSGFYYVEAAGHIYECRARGIFRKKGQGTDAPLVGDRVNVCIPQTGMPMVDKVFERKNRLIRPPVANIDILVIVISTADPAPNAFVIDKMIAICEGKSIEPVLVFTKNDLKCDDEIVNAYKSAGFTCFSVSPDDISQLDEIRSCMAGRVSAFAGNSGVGKSTLLNLLDSRLAQRTDEISKKLGRGKHTTRHVELFTLENGALIADTPGFSSLELEEEQIAEKENMWLCFREFEDFGNDCKFKDCAHVKEKDCAVKKALEDKKISQSRYESYLKLYEEAKGYSKW